LTNKIADLKLSEKIIQQEVVAVKQEMMNVFVLQIAEHSEQLASHDTRLDVVAASISQRQNCAGPVIKATDLIIKGGSALSPCTTPHAGSSFDPLLLVKFSKFYDKEEFHRH
jgi:hypothetical protein